MRRLSKITASITVGVASFMSFAPTTGFTSPGPVPAHVTFQTVRLGSSGPRVVQVQQALRSLGYTLAADGIFGPRTDAAVRTFQASRNLVADGIVGPRTSAALGLSPSTTAPSTGTVPVSSRASLAVKAAMSQIGVPYRYASAVPGVAFDCSGLTSWAWGQAGVYLPHQSSRQYASIPHVSRDQIRPGDLIFSYSPISHVGMYVGNGQMVHARYPGVTVAVTAIRWDRVVGIGRPG